MTTMLIKSSASLCEDYEAFSQLAHQSQEPIYITKDGEGDLVLLSIEAFENIQKSTYNTPLQEWNKQQDSLNVGGEHMTEHRLGNILKELYCTAARGQQVANIHTFAIYYANVIERERLNKKEILRIAGLPETYQTEISKGINLAQYVEVKEDVVQRIHSIENLCS